MEKLQTGVESVLLLQTFGKGGSDSTTSISRHQRADARDAVRLQTTPQYRDGRYEGV